MLARRERGAQHSGVVLRLRGRNMLGGTLVDVLCSYAEDRMEVKVRCYLTGIKQEVYKQIHRPRKLRLNERVRAYEVTPTVGEAAERAVNHAEAWLVSLEGDERDESGQEGEQDEQGEEEKGLQ